MGDKTRNTAIQLVLQYYCKKSCMFLVARFSAPIVLSCGWFATLKKRTPRSSNAPLIEISLVKGRVLSIIQYSTGKCEAVCRL